MDFDVAIVGAGPAGAWTAYRLARAGARVAIVDASHPREKPCGGGVTGRALAMVADAIRDRLQQSEIICVQSARFGDAVVPLAGGALVVASRTSFDAALVDAAQRAGAVLIAERAIDVAVDRARVIVRSARAQYDAAFLVGADGANSLVRRRLACPFRREQLSIATGFYAHGATSREIAIEFVPEPAGYIWSFPRPDHLAIGICAQADAGATAAALRLRVSRWLEARRETGSRVALKPYSWPVPSLGRADFEKPLAGPRWLLAGDAAGLVDPITREGIFFALQSAEHAAAALQGPDAAVAYAALVRDEIVPELARAAELKTRFFTRPFVQLLVGALKRSDAIRAVMADLVAGRQSYRALEWRLLKTFEWRLALDAARVWRSPASSASAAALR